MGLWYETGNGMVQTKLARKENPIDAYLCCPGPSLKNVKDTEIHQPGAMICAINTAYPHIRPDIWIGMDEPECYNKSIWWEPFMKIARGGYQDRRCAGFDIKNCPNVFFADCKEPHCWTDLFTIRQHDATFVWHRNTLAITLHILVWLGFKHIHLLGCDLGGETDYYHDLVLSEKNRRYNRQLYNQQKTYLHQFAQEGKKHNITLISCTPHSPINQFLPFMTYQSALARSKSIVPQESQIKHVLDVIN